jgi:hypothetical protein
MHIVMMAHCSENPTRNPATAATPHSAISP